MTYKLDNNTETKDGYIFIETSYENVTNVTPVSNDSYLFEMVNERAKQLGEDISDLKNIAADHIDWLNHGLKSFIVLRKDDLIEDLINIVDDPCDEDIIAAAVKLGWVS